MEQNTKEVQVPPVKDQETQVKKETQALHHDDFGRVERGVRALIGVPLVISFTYVRHFYLWESIVFLIVGLYLTGTSVFQYCAIRHLIYWIRWKRPSLI